MNKILLSSLVFASFTAAGCSSDDAETIELAGSWDTNFGTSEDIDSVQWGTAAVVYFDNEMNFAITQNASDAEFSPSKFNKLVWTEPSGDFAYYCTVDFGKDSADEAENTTNVADSSDLEVAGCGGFGWTKITTK